MKNILSTLQLAIATLGGYIGFFLGGWDGFIYTLAVLTSTDYITGVIAAALEHRLSSDIGFRGIAKKVLMFVLVGIGHLVDSQIIGSGSVFRTAVLFFFISNEALSVLENCSRIGLPVPKKLIDFLEKMREENNE